MFGLASRRTGLIASRTSPPHVKERLRVKVMGGGEKELLGYQERNREPILEVRRQMERMVPPAGHLPQI